MKKFAFLLVIVTAIVTCAQTPVSRKSKSDAEKIATALQGGPEFATRNATVLDNPTSPRRRVPGSPGRTNGWTCLPGIPEATHDEPGCFDRVFLQFLQDSYAGRTPNAHSIGISSMYGGMWLPNKWHVSGVGNEYHVGRHIMIIGLDQKLLQTYNHDASTGEPYVNHLPGHPEFFLVIPIRHWDDAQAGTK